MHDDRAEWHSTLENGTKVCSFLLAVIGGQYSKKAGDQLSGLPGGLIYE